MDDFDYSVQISEHDWDAFFQECEECDLLPPTLAGLEDSGMSDADDALSSRSSKDPHVAKEMEFSESEISDNEPPECTGWPVERYLCACDRPDPESILSCSEEDTHLESVNMFFERLKDIADGGQLPGEGTPEEERLGGGCAKDPTVLMHLPQGESQTDSKETMSVKTHSTEMGETDVIRARKSVETESDDEVSKSPKPTEEFNEENKTEKGCYPSKNKCEPLHSLSSNDEFRNLQFPEAYDYFFPDDSPVASEDDEDSDQEPIRVVTRYNKGFHEPLGAAATPDAYEHFFTEDDWKQQGTSLLSTIYTDSVLHCHGTVSPQAPLYCLEEQIFKELAERQRKYAELPNVIAVPKSPIVTLKQSDMCLICIAFASWVLRTGNPQDADTWKAALLANVSALSAIRYLRRNVRGPSPE
ncbi:hypothetical protein AGOR_G00135530 [Albula goreensis]|uniref:PGC-1 and ERR-induced regulator in muscle protein 1 n=1 Tax=Albula goreensis TaxID=1534307 RepID=A0A8T3DCJ4_9TELE|nr:hypothetical protein AGOR_G00135530 [Albula goreensis]